MSVKFRIILTLASALILSMYDAIAQPTPSGARSVGMGRSSVALTDIWGINNNQAGIALITNPMVGICYENKFMLKEISNKSIAAIFPTKFGVLGASYNHFGYHLYNQQKIGLAYARSFSKYFRVGVQLDYLITSLGNNYGNNSNITFELGIQSDVSKKITLGAWVYNPIHVQLADYNNEKIPIVMRFGFLWNLAKNTMITIEAEKNTSISPIVIRGGVEYSIKKKYYFRGGFSTSNEIFSFGAGIIIKNIAFDISSIMHETMGFSTQASLNYHF